VARLGRGQDPELGQVRRPDDDEAGVAQPADEVGRVVGFVLGEEARAEVHAHPLDRHVGLDGDGHAGERPLVAGLDRLRGGHRPVPVDLHERVDAVVERLYALERGADRLARRHLSAADERSEVGDREEHEVGRAHRASAD
jgi:hypothetical protein